MLLTTIFEPVNKSNYTLSIICAVIAIASILALVFYYRKPKKLSPDDLIDGSEYKPDRFGPLRSMGFFFVFLICITTGFLSWLKTTKITPVTINEKYIETNYGKAEWSDIQRIYIHEDQKVAPFSGREVGAVTKILMIIEIDGRTHALSEDNYDIKAMGKAIKANISPSIITKPNASPSDKTLEK